MGNAKILIVDNDKSTAKLLQAILTRSGHAVVGTISSGEEAAENGLTLLPDLIIMNIQLRGKIDGITTYEQIKQMRDIPVLFLSRYTDKRTIARAMKHKPCGYLTKPFLIHEFLGKVEKALAENRT